MQIEALEIKNYRLFRDAKLVDLPRLTIVVGANGSGKSTLFDIFSFLKEALNHNVAQAAARRGGFRELVSRGASGPIGISVKFRESGGRLATYSLSIAEEDGRAIIEREILRYRRGGHGRPWHFVFPNSGVCLKTGISLIFTSAMPGRAPRPVTRSIFPPAATTWPRWRSTCLSATRNALSGYLKRCVSACPGWRRSRRSPLKTAGSCSGFRTAASKIPLSPATFPTAPSRCLPI